MMTLPQQAMPFRLAHSSLQLALRFWPEESRDWGNALAQNSTKIEKPFEALRWAIGGLMLFSRASASHFLTWLKLPAGARLSTTPRFSVMMHPFCPNARAYSRWRCLPQPHCCFFCRTAVKHFPLFAQLGWDTHLGTLIEARSKGLGPAQTKKTTLAHWPSLR